MKVTWLGNASIIITQGKTSVGFDPFLGLNDCENPCTLEDFSDLTDICITHGHFDHIYSLPDILSGFDGSFHLGSVSSENIRELSVSYPTHIIKPKDAFSAGNLKITVYNSAHVRFDKMLVLKTLASLRKPSDIRKSVEMGKLLKRLPEGGQTYAFHIKGKKSILLFGSLARDEHTAYPFGVDLLILPYQGNSKVLDIAMDLVSMIKPKTVMLSHFDNAFPPLSQHINTEPFVYRMSLEYPGIKVIIPKFKQVYKEF